MRKLFKIGGIDFFKGKKNIRSYKILKNGNWQFTMKIVNFKYFWILFFTKSTGFSFYYNENKNKNKIYTKRNDEDMSDFIMGMEKDFGVLWDEQWNLIKNWTVIIAIILTTLGLTRAQAQEFDFECQPSVKIANNIYQGEWIGSVLARGSALRGRADTCDNFYPSSCRPVCNVFVVEYNTYYDFQIHEEQVRVANLDLPLPDSGYIQRWLQIVLPDGEVVVGKHIPNATLDGYSLFHYIRSVDNFEFDLPRDGFNLSNTSFSSRINACADGLVNGFYFHNGCENEPEIGDYVFENRDSIHPLDIDGWRVISEGTTKRPIRLESGMVVEKDNCN